MAEVHLPGIKDRSSWAQPAATSGFQKWGNADAEPGNPTRPKSSSRLQNSAKTNYQILHEKFSTPLSDHSLMTVRRLTEMAANNLVAQREIKRRFSTHQAKMEMGMDTLLQSIDGEARIRRSGDVVKLLSVWDKHKERFLEPGSSEPASGPTSSSWQRKLGGKVGMLAVQEPARSDPGNLEPRRSNKDYEMLKASTVFVGALNDMDEASLVRRATLYQQRLREEGGPTTPGAVKNAVIRLLKPELARPATVAVMSSGKLASELPSSPEPTCPFRPTPDGVEEGIVVGRSADLHEGGGPAKEAEEGPMRDQQPRPSWEEDAVGQSESRQGSGRDPSEAEAEHGDLGRPGDGASSSRPTSGFGVSTQPQPDTATAAAADGNEAACDLEEIKSSAFKFENCVKEGRDSATGGEEEGTAGVRTEAEETAGEETEEVGSEGGGEGAPGRRGKKKEKTGKAKAKKGEGEKKGRKEKSPGKRSKSAGRKPKSASTLRPSSPSRERAKSPSKKGRTPSVKGKKKKKSKRAVMPINIDFRPVIPPPPFSPGPYELSPTNWPIMSAKLVDCVVQKNPAGFTESAAEYEVASYHESAERGKQVLQRTQVLPSDAAEMRSLRGSMLEMSYRRPFLQLPPSSRGGVARAFQEIQLKLPDGSPVHGSPRRLKSVFAVRAMESDSRSLLDTHKVFTRQLALDWRRVTSKERFRRLLRDDPFVAQGRQSVEQASESLYAVLLDFMILMQNVFVYYAATSTSGQGSMMLTVGKDDWRRFIEDAGIMDAKCGWELCEEAFDDSNYEANKDTFESKINIDDRLMRFEFMEAVIRMAVLKYIRKAWPEDPFAQIQNPTGLSGALARLLLDRCQPNLPPAALLDPNEWRQARLYSPEVDECLQKHVWLLKPLFELFCRRNGSKIWLNKGGWLSFLESNDLIGHQFLVSLHDAMLAFAWSKMTVIDEVQGHERSSSLSWPDFVEAMVRLIDLISPPPRKQLDEQSGEAVAQKFGMPQSGHPYFTYYSNLTEREAVRCRRDSAELLAPKTQPLPDKIDAFMDYFTQSVHIRWSSGGDEVKLVSSIHSMSHLIDLC